MNIRQLSLAASVGLALCAFSPMASAQTTLTISTWLPRTHPVPKAIMTWARDLEKASDGRIKAQMLAKAVTAPPGHYNAVRDGLADVSYTVLGYTPGRFDLSKFAEFPLTSSTAEQGSAAFYRVASRHAAIMEEYKDVKVIGLFVHGPGVIFNTKKAITSVADLQGLKFRVGGGLVNDVAIKMAVNSTLKPAGSSYELLSTGVMDGTWLPFDGITTFKLDKLVRHATTFPGGLYNSAFIAMMNRKTYESLTRQDQLLVDKMSGENLSKMLGRAFDQRDTEGKALAQAAGITTTAASAEFVKEVSTRTNALEQQWIDNAKGKGLDDGAAILKEFRAESAK